MNIQATLSWLADKLPATLLKQMEESGCLRDDAMLKEMNLQIQNYKNSCPPIRTRAETF